MVESSRIKELKQLKKLANAFLDFYRTEHQVKTKGWEKNLIRRNIALLTQTIQKINLNLHPEKVGKYLQAIQHSPSSSPITNSEQEYLGHLSTIIHQGSNLSLLKDIIRCSPRISYFNDLSWFKHGTVREHIDYGLGNKDEAVFEKYLPGQINRMEKLKETFFKKDPFRDDYTLIESILPLIKRGNFIPANILIITLTEGLVRKFCFHVMKGQNPDKSDAEIDNSIYKGKSSFELLLRDTTWAKDIPVPFNQFLIEYSHTEHPIVEDFEKKLILHKAANKRIDEIVTDLQVLTATQIKNQDFPDEDVKQSVLKSIAELKAESENLLTEEERIVSIGIDIYLDFLVKKFKDDRNNIIHGKYSFFKEKWKTLVYLTALDTLIGKIIWYEDKIGF